MFEVTTEVGDERIVWQVSVPWEVRRQMLRSEGIVSVGGGGFVNPPALEPLVIPECISGWNQDGEPTAEAIYDRALSHVLSLLQQVGEWAISGVLPGEARPLASASQ